MKLCFRDLGTYADFPVLLVWEYSGIGLATISLTEESVQ